MQSDSSQSNPERSLMQLRVLWVLLEAVADRNVGRGLGVEDCRLGCEGGCNRRGSSPSPPRL